MAVFKKYGESLLDQPIGIEEARVRNAEQHGTFQDSSRFRRIARRGYREAMRNKDWQSAAKALDWLETKGQTLGSGIEPAGMRMQQARERTARGRGEGLGEFRDPIKDQNLTERLGLFAQMKDSIAKGADTKQYWEHAKGLGVTPAGFGNAMERARREVDLAPGQKPVTPGASAIPGATFGNGAINWNDKSTYPTSTIPQGAPVTTGAPMTPETPVQSTSLLPANTFGSPNLFSSNSPNFDERNAAQAAPRNAFERLNLSYA